MSIEFRIKTWWLLSHLVWYYWIHINIPMSFLWDSANSNTSTWKRLLLTPWCTSSQRRRHNREDTKLNLIEILFVVLTLSVWAVLELAAPQVAQSWGQGRKGKSPILPQCWGEGRYHPLSPTLLWDSERRADEISSLGLFLHTRS